MLGMRCQVEILEEIRRGLIEQVGKADETLDLREPTNFIGHT